MNRRLAVALALAGLMVSFADAGVVFAVDWSTVELAWQNDPRPAADAALPVDPLPPRRTSRRAQRRSIRHVEVAPSSPNAPRMTPGLPAGSGILPDETAVLPTTQAEAAGAEPNAIEARNSAAPASRAIVHRDVSSGSHPRQRFDVLLPEGCSGGGLPLVIWIHGSDWRSGTKADCPVAWLVEQGFAVACIDYRPSDVAVFPAQLDDCRAAVDAIRADATTWGIDPSRICVAGVGGGGHLAALLAFSQPDLGPIHETADGSPDAEGTDELAAVAVFDAPCHLPSLGGVHDRAGSAASRLVGGPLPEFREAAQKASPLVHVSTDDPPALVVQSGRGDGVAPDQGERLVAALRTAGVEGSLVTLDATAADLVPRRGSPAAGALLEFLDRTLGTGRGPRED